MTLPISVGFFSAVTLQLRLLSANFTTAVTAIRNESARLHFAESIGGVTGMAADDFGKIVMA